MVGSTVWLVLQKKNPGKFLIAGAALHPPQWQEVLLLAMDRGFRVSSILQKPGCAQAPSSCPALAASLGAGRLSTGRRGSLGVCTVFQSLSVPGLWCGTKMGLTE